MCFDSFKLQFVVKFSVPLIVKAYWSLVFKFFNFQHFSVEVE